MKDLILLHGALGGRKFIKSIRIRIRKRISIATHST